MTHAIDLDAHVREVIDGAISSRSFLGEDYGYSVNWSMNATVTGEILFAWNFMFTCKGPLIGQPDLGHVRQMQTIGPPPADAEIEQCVADCLAKLAEKKQAALGIGNGNGNGGKPKGPLAIPGLN